MKIICTPEKKFLIPLQGLGPNELNFAHDFNKDSIEGLLALLSHFSGSSSLKSYLPQVDEQFHLWKEFLFSVLRYFIVIENEKAQDKVDKEEEVISLLKQYQPQINYAELEKIYFSPALQGLRENFTREDFGKLWSSLLVELNAKLQKFPGDKNQFIRRHFPEWSGVGLIHFHLAETASGAKWPFAFLATCSTKVSEKVRIQHMPLAKAFEKYKTAKQHDLILSLLKPIENAAEKNTFVSWLSENGKLFETCFLSASEAYRLIQAIPVLSQEGIVVKLPKSWGDRKASTAKVSVQMMPSKEGNNSLGSMFTFNPQITIDGRILDTKELEAVLLAHEELVRIDGHWVAVDGTSIQSLLKKWHKANYLNQQGYPFSQAMRMIAGIRQEEQKVTEKESEILEFTFSKPVEKVLNDMLHPRDLKSQNLEILNRYLFAKLRPYQLKGVSWLHMINQLALGGCLADDMGLGKTIQIISLFLLEKYVATKRENKVNLLIVPVSLIGNWQDEIAKFAPSLQVLIVHGSCMNRNEMQNAQSGVCQYDLVITTYHQSYRLEWLQKHTWNILILDEAQAIKNPRSLQTKSIKSLNRRVAISMTGTPIENSLWDLWSLFDFSCPGLLGNESLFKKHMDQFTEGRNYSKLVQLLRPYLLRRKKNDPSIITDLPDKIEIKSFCTLTQKQYFLYEKLLKKFKEELEESEKEENKSENGNRRRGLILSYLLKFKQICNHPSQYLNDQDYVYHDSGKFLRLQEISKNIVEKGEKVLIFTQFREITDILANILEKVFARSGFVLHGGTPVQERKRMVDEFQNDSLPGFFILSVKAGGTGLNLTAASHIIHFDRWWNPAVENQATDRAYRIGQKNNVLVHKFICRGTIEEKIDRMISSKNELSHQVIENIKYVDWFQLENKDLIDLVSLDLTSMNLLNEEEY